MQDETQSSKSGCGSLIGKGCGVIVLAFVVIIGAGLVWNAFFDDTERILMRGEIVISRSVDSSIPGSPCTGIGQLDTLREGQVLSIRPSGEAPVLVDLPAGSVGADSRCIFSFGEQVPVADSYTFAISGLPDQSVRRSMIDTRDESGGDVFLQVQLSWD